MKQLRSLLTPHLVPRASIAGTLALLLLRLTVGYGLFEAGTGKLHKLAGTCAADPLPECEGAECEAKRAAACAQQGQQAIAWFGSLTLFGIEDLHLPGGGEVNFRAAAFNESVFGTAMMLGLATRVVAVPLVATMTVAMVTAHWDTIGWELRFVSEIAFVYLMILLSLLALGPGRLSLDALIVRFLAR